MYMIRQHNSESCVVHQIYQYIKLDTLANCHQPLVPYWPGWLAVKTVRQIIQSRLVTLADEGRLVGRWKAEHILSANLTSGRADGGVFVVTHQPYI